MIRIVSSRLSARILLAAGAISLLTASVAAAQPAKFAWIGGDRVVGKAFIINPNVAIPAYTLTFFTAQQGTSVASIEARSRLTSVLAGVEPAVMKKLANEAHADLKAKLVAAGVPVVSDEVARSAVAGLATLPNNSDIKPLKAGITIGGGVQKAWATFGADAAPGLDAYNNPAASPAKQMGVIGANRVTAQGSRRIASALLMPALIFDFADTSTSTGRSLVGAARSSVDSEIAFILRAGSGTTFVSTIPAGPAVGFGGVLSTGKDIVSATPFATVATGEAAVRALSVGPTDGLGNNNTRGDAVVVDLAVWEGLVRQTFQDYNSALVATVVKGRGG